MNIIYLTTSFPRFSGDYAGVFVYDLAKSLVDDGVCISVVAPHTERLAYREDMAGIDTHRFRYFYPTAQQKLAYGAGIPTNLRRSWLARLQIPLFLLSFFLKGFRLAKRGQVIHAHWIEPGFLGLLLARILKRPLVVSVHRFNPMGQVGRLLYRWVLPQADYILFNSSYTQRRCLEYLSVKKSGIVPPGINLEKFPLKWNLPQQKDTCLKVFALGSLLPVKGFIHLVRAMPQVLEIHPQCQFIIGGQGPEREALLTEAEKLGVAHHLQLLGRVPTEDVPKWMCEADVFVLSSVPHASGDNEALGMVLVEAMACGTPCVASRTGGIVDVVDDCVNGFLVSPGDSGELADRIIQLLHDESMREQMGQAGREKVEKRFALDVIAHQVEDIYTQLCT
ncbi:MAG: hypothetical protein CSB13_02460 [Chloroflexi bacterium]|nr:MAG: hypothetical protein CSB13_02460 [Chloroflexota bacterium]